MRRYTINIDEEAFVVDIEETSGNTFAVRLADGEPIAVHLVDHQEMSEPIGIAGNHPNPAPSAIAAARVERIARPAAHNARPTAPGGGGGKSGLQAPMPGVVLTIEVSPGATVGRGQTLLILEAMKMKNELKAERDAVVSKIHVGNGDQVKFGDLLIEFEN
ncbi:MAG: acetyl-CoA carboxylase biotin carboxyl carrier protein subunit [Propionibacteriaceae bacterium]|jgi:biotin carboxyl carrier protein|nr:acetyl-CoA carboxylase biotin carboxyl carrier protein subunit [Propionibacteriaceae bacterium]